MIVRINPEKRKHRSDSVTHNKIVHLSGAVPFDVSKGIRDQAVQVLAEIDKRLTAAGTDKSQLLSATIWLADVHRDATAFNEVWNTWVILGCEPARATVGADLQMGAALEIAVVAAVP